jgi:hypothetical protein
MRGKLQQHDHVLGFQAHNGSMFAIRDSRKANVEETPEGAIAGTSTDRIYMRRLVRPAGAIDGIHWRLALPAEGSAHAPSAVVHTVLTAPLAVCVRRDDAVRDTGRGARRVDLRS